MIIVVTIIAIIITIIIVIMMNLPTKFIFAIPNAIKLCCTTHCLSVDFAIGNGRKENLLGFNSKMKKEEPNSRFNIQLKNSNN